MKRLSLAFAVFACFAGLLFAVPPAWWSEEGTRVLDPDISDADNHSPANLGQLKHMAKQAKMHLDAALPGGSGPAIASLVEAFEPRIGQGYTQAQIDAFREQNYAPINLGQLKAVAKPFYERLLAAGFDTKANLIAHGYPANWAYDYPWNPQTPVEENYAPANLGQVKMTFSFGLVNFLSPAWQQQYFGATSGADPAADPDGDGLTNLQEYQQGSDPRDHYNGSLPVLTKQNGDNQSGESGTVLPNPLVVKVMTSSGIPLANAPVAFSISGSFGQIATTATGLFGSTLNIVTGTAGTASVYLKPSGTAGTVNHVQALASSGTNSVSVVYSATAEEGGLKVNPSELVLEVLADEEAQSSLTLSNESFQPVDYGVRFYGELETGAIRPHEGDTYGYRWATSDDVGGPEYVWQDISATGSLLEYVSDADDGNESVTLPFAFSFYGETFTEVFVGSNGYLTCGAGSFDFNDSELPSSGSPGRLIAALFRDLNPGSQGEIYYQADENKAVFQFENVESYDGGEFYTFQIVLDKGGGIRYYYKDIDGAVDNVTVGVQNEAGDEGFSLQYGSSLLRNQFAVLISDKGIRWVEAIPASGSIASQGGMALLLKARPPGVPTGDYTGQAEFYDAAEEISPAWLDVTVRVKVATTSTDGDGDGLPDAWETGHFGGLSQAGKNDSDEDGLNNAEELAAETDPNAADTDDDGVSDSEEILNGTNPLAEDTDGDGALDRAEALSGTDPLASDTDLDGMLDGYELTHGLNPFADDTLYDKDGDGVPNQWEFAKGTAAGDRDDIPAWDWIVDAANAGAWTTDNIVGSISEAINGVPVDNGNVAESYRTILVKGREHAENVVIPVDKRIALVGEQGAQPVRLVGAGAVNSVLEVSGRSVVERFWITRPTSVLRTGVPTGKGVNVQLPVGQKCRLGNIIVSGQKNGAAVACQTGGSMILDHCTIFGNQADAVWSYASNVFLEGSILWNPLANEEILGGVTAVSNIIRGGGNGGINEDPLLRANGTLSSASPAIDRDTVTTVLGGDIHGETRPSGDVRDIGADEWIDSDSDDLPDVWEMENFGDLEETATGDPDDDDLDNVSEYLNGTNPADADSDDDGLNDGAEVATGSDPNAGDSDLDGMLDDYEIANGLNPFADDTLYDKDGDGVPNHWEFAKGTAAGDRDDIPAWDLIVDAANAGASTLDNVVGSISEAINAVPADNGNVAESYRTILVKRRDYAENVVIPENKRIALVGEKGWQVVRRCQ